MTDTPDPTALRLEGQRLVEAATPGADPYEDLSDEQVELGRWSVNNLPTLLTTLAALTEELDALIRDKEEAQSLLEWPFASVRELANETGRLRMNEHALTEERDEAVKRAEKAGNTAVNLNELLIAAEARAAAMEAALEEISGHAPVKTPPDYATSSDTGEAFDDGYSRGVWEMGQIADAALAQPGTGGAT